jgi:hypothetical protein
MASKISDPTSNAASALVAGARRRPRRTSRARRPYAGRPHRFEMELSPNWSLVGRTHDSTVRAALVHHDTVKQSS